MVLINLFFFKWFTDEGQSTAKHSGTEDSVLCVRDDQEGCCLRAGISHPCCIHLAGPLTIVSSDMLCWLPCKVIFFLCPIYSTSFSQNIQYKLIVTSVNTGEIPGIWQEQESWKPLRNWKWDCALVEGTWTVNLRVKLTISLTSHCRRKLLLSWSSAWPFP